MWSLLNVGAHEPKMKGFCQMPFQLLGGVAPFATINHDKQFSYFRNSGNPSVPCPKSYVAMETEAPNSSQPPEALNPGPRKKKKRRRRRRKKTKRERQISVAESEDSFVIAFEDCSSHTNTDFDSLESISVLPQKKVRFAEVLEVHTMIMWSYAYHAARKGPWEECARDRARFACRINQTETLISHVFDPDHRLRIYQDRFSSID